MLYNSKLGFKKKKSSYNNKRCTVIAILSFYYNTINND